MISNGFLTDSGPKDPLYKPYILTLGLLSAEPVELCPKSFVYNKINGVLVCTGPKCSANATWNPLTRQCEQKCPVEPLKPITDPDALHLENVDPVWESKLTPLMKSNLACLRAAIAKEPATGGKPASFTLNSAWRKVPYQQHLLEIRDKKIALNSQKNLSIPACAPIRASVIAESNRHGLGNHPVALDSLHSIGSAFDASWRNISDARIDALAATCSLSRPIPNDRPHFQ